MAANLTHEQSAFIEEMGQFLGGYGMTPMAGRMWGWLLLCDPPEQTAAEIAEALGASRGSISGTARILVSAGFIRRTTKRGDRREYFSSPPDALDSMLDERRRHLPQLRRIAERGLVARRRCSRAACPDAGVLRRHLVHRDRAAAHDRSLLPRAIGRPAAAGSGRRTTDDTVIDHSAGPGRPKGVTVTAIIQTEKLTKSYGSHRGHHRHRSRRERGRGIRLPRPERGRQDDDDPDAARPHPPDVGPGARLRHRDDRRPGRDPPPDRLPARRVRPLRQADRRPDDRVLREPPRRRRRGLPGAASSTGSTSTRAASSRSTRRATSRRSA